MVAHDAMHDGQAQPCTLADGFGGEEWLENPFQHGCIHAGAVVAHADGHVVAGRQPEPLAQAQVRAGGVAATCTVPRLSPRAWMALVHRLSKACSTRGVGQDRGMPCGKAIWSSTVGGSVTRSRRSVSCMTSASATAVRRGGSLRLKVRIWRTRSRARRPAFSISIRLSRSRGLAAAVGLGEFHVAEDRAQDVVEVVRDAPAMVPMACILCDSRNWASSSVRWASAFLRPVRSRATTVVVSPSVWRSNDTLTSTASSRPAAVRAVISPSGGLGGKLGKCQGLRRVGQEALQRAAQRVAGAALEQGGGRGVEHGDAPVLIDTDDGVQRRVDHRLRRFSLACSCSLRSCRAWRSASSGLWSMTAHKTGAGAGYLPGQLQCRRCAGPR